MEIKITYCSVWNYQPRAAGLADLIKKETGITPELIPGSNGIYDIKADNAMLYSKHETGNFPDEADIIDRIQALIS